MNFGRKFRAATSLLLVACLAWSPAQALVALNDGRDRIFVNLTFNVSRDSNVFANRDNVGDFVYSSGIAAEYTRRAGWIGVNASVSVSASQFGENKEQNFSNPSYSLELTKQSGRTTGSFTINGARESRADAAINMRSTSWNYHTGLNVKYPAGAYTFAGHMGYSSRKYVEDTIFADLATFDTSVDMFRILPNERELIVGYRYRASDTSRNTSSADHGLNAGLSGRLIRGIMGNIRGGYQVRIPQGVAGAKSVGSWTLSGSSTYAVSKKLNLSGQIAKDFSTTATDASVDVTNATLDASYALRSRWSISGSAGWGDTQFLGEGGREVVSLGPPVVFGAQRHDTYATWNTSLNYSLNEHLKTNLSYVWFKNWSTSPIADFVRSSWNLNLSSRW